MEKLKQMAIAYNLAQEFDYCPDDLNEAKKYDSRATKEIINKYQGSRGDEIARMIVAEILRAE